MHVIEIITQGRASRQQQHASPSLHYCNFLYQTSLTFDGLHTCGRTKSFDLFNVNKQTNKTSQTPIFFRPRVVLEKKCHDRKFAKVVK